MDDSCRPVRLRKVVLGYPCSESYSEFRFDLSLNYKIMSVIDTYSDHKPTLVVSGHCFLLYQFNVCCTVRGSYGATELDYAGDIGAIEI